MSASAAATIVFHHLDPATEPAVRELLIEQSFRPWFHKPMTATLHTNTGYGRLHADLEVCTRMGRAIRELDPSAVFEICQDPGENIAGQRIVFHPEYGEHHSAGTRDGAALLDADLVLVHLERIRAALDTGADPGPALDGLDRAAGGPWARDLPRRNRERREDPTR